MKINDIKIKKIISIIIILIILIIYSISFANYSVSKLKPIYQNAFSGFHGEEDLDGQFYFYWMKDKEALIKIKPISNTIIFPIFCFKPNIQNEPVTLQIILDNKLVYNYHLSDNNVKYIKIHLDKLGYKMTDKNIIDIKFTVNKLWSPGGKDQRNLGVAVGKIEFLRD